MAAQKSECIVSCMLSLIVLSVLRVELRKAALIVRHDRERLTVHRDRVATPAYPNWCDIL